MTAIDTHGQGAAAHGHDDHHDHPAHLAHHFESPQQQFEAGKLGMWLFLATEFLLFGGLFGAYAVYRHNHPELFAYGSQFLDVKYGGTNTVVLILSSLTMAMSVTAAQLGRKRQLITLLTLTFLGGCMFMGIKYIEYKKKFEDNIVWGTGLYEVPEHSVDKVREAFRSGESVEAATATATLDPEEAVVETIGDLEIPRSQIKSAAEGPRGLSEDAKRVAGAPVDRELDTEHAAGGQLEHDDHYPEPEGYDDHGAHGGHGHPDPRTDPNRPPNAHLFFGIYFVMTGLHGLHVLAGMAVIGWLIVKAARGHFSSEYFTPVDFGGLYWHVVDLIWIFLFPLLYLIH
jgi:cytochrome c oxidase subunit 3